MSFSLFGGVVLFLGAPLMRHCDVSSLGLRCRVFSVSTREVFAGIDGDFAWWCCTDGTKRGGGVCDVRGGGLLYARAGVA